MTDAVILRAHHFWNPAMKGISTSRSNQLGSTLAGVLVGLIIGIIIAAGLALYINFGPKPFVAKPDNGSSGAAQSNAASTAEGSTPIALPGKPGEQPVEKPKFDFYKILPGGETASAPTVEPGPTIRTPEKIYLQAGAYQNPSDADNLKARLAMMGIESNVQRVDLAERGVFYRVRLGPFVSREAADSLRARMATEGIESAVVRSNLQSSSGGTKTASSSAPKQ